MTALQPTAVLAYEIDDRIAEFSRKRQRDKWKAFSFKMASVALGAVVTVLLGLKIEGAADVLRNAALAAGALISVVNAWDSFFDHRGLWIKRTVTVLRLKRLRRELALAMAAAPNGALGGADLSAFEVRLSQILDDDVAEWVQLRKESVARPGATPGAEEMPNRAGP